ncbi:hypothetical protein [Zhihengliuella sp.]|uniref:hypothetical protein n=2 Tax=Zhihengliuella sp. TaxID=1954483 RepID=UPI0028114742|nr:hypothetical protein [Zhihengliuella sp.]
MARPAMSRLVLIAAAMAVVVALVAAGATAGIVHLVNQARGAPAPVVRADDDPLAAAASASQTTGITAAAVASDVRSAPSSTGSEGAGKNSDRTPRAAAIKEEAVVRGRPAAAFDEFCEVWTYPTPATDGQAWANRVTESWLAAHGAECPDAVVIPGYFIQSTMPGDDGELVVTLEDAPGALAALKPAARDIIDRTAAEYPELERVTAKTANGETSSSYTRGQWEIRVPFRERAAMAAENPEPASTLIGQEWADEKMNQWLTKIRADEIAELSAGFKLITRWSSPAPGELVVYLDAALLEQPHLQGPHMTIDIELQGIAVTILDNIYFDAPELKQVTAVLENGAAGETVRRGDKWFTH